MHTSIYLDRLIYTHRNSLQSHHQGGLSGEADGPRPVWSKPEGYKAVWEIEASPNWNPINNSTNMIIYVFMMYYTFVYVVYKHNIYI